ncbi:MAG: mechanosensitive ion channel [Phycisphaera sp.]|nr:mechanosensitive ion channel [Phycisphaera sp.]
MPHIDEQTWQLINEYAVPGATALVIMLVAYFIAGWVSKIVSVTCTKAHIEMTLTKFFAKLTKWAILVVGVMFVLSKFGIETASFAVMLGAMGLAVGLAFQGTLSNFASGIMLLVFRPYKVGDFVVVGGHQGTVDELELFTTTLDTLDHRRIFVPNSAIFGQVIENMTYHPVRRVDVAVGVSYKCDLDETRRVLLEAAQKVEGIESEPQPQIYLLGLGASSVDWEVRVWCKPAVYWDVRDRTTRAAKVALDHAGLSIPFPQMDVHLDYLNGKQG